MKSKERVNFKVYSGRLKEISYLIRYAGSGVINTIFGFIIIFTLMALGVSPVISNIAGYAFGFILGFLLSKKIVFQSNGRFVSESIRYLVAFVLSFILNLAVLQFALIYLKFNSIVSQLLASISYTLLMYLLSRIYIFKNLN